MKALRVITSGAVLAAALLAAAFSGAQTGSAPAWPEVVLPPGAASYSMGEQMSVDGMPMRAQGFELDMSPERTAAWFRQHMPRPLMENRFGDKLVLGRASGAYYITVQLSGSGGRTQGLVAVSDVAAGLVQRTASRAANARVAARLPSGTQVLTALNSTDAQRTASFLTLVNSYSEEVNRERLKQMLREDGMELERESRAADAGAKALAALPAGAASGRAMFFKGRGREAIAVISRMPDSRVSIVLNTVTTMETYP